MDFKSVVLENAWGRVKMDYGLLHAQLGTPIVTAIIIFIMVLVLNKLLFQPVLRTLDNRKKIIHDSQQTVETTRDHIEKLRQEYDKQLEVARTEINRLYLTSRQDAQKKKDQFLVEARQAADTEMAKGQQALNKEIGAAKNQLQPMISNLAGLTVTRLLN